MKTLKALNHLLAASILLISLGCSMYTKTSFSQYRGPSEFRGEGGTVRPVDGIDVWETGTPDRRCRILGVIQQSHYDNHSLMSMIAGGSKDSAIIKEAKAAGGDAIIVLSSMSAITGFSTHSSVEGSSSGNLSGYSTGGAYTGTYSGTSSAYGTSHTSADITSAKIVVVLKYLD